MNWGDTFSDAFTKSYVQRAQEEFDKWKYGQEKDLMLAKMGYTQAPQSLGVENEIAQSIGMPTRVPTNIGGQQYIPSNQMQSQTPVMTFDESGNLRLVPNMPSVPKGTRIIPPSQMQTPAQKAEAAANAPTADMKNMIKSTEQASALFTDLKKQSEKLQGGYEGMQKIAEGAVTRGKGDTADYRVYLSTLPSASVSLYRAITGDTRLSDADAQARAYPLLWHPSEDVSVRQKKNEFIDNMIVARKALLKKGTFQTDENGNAITPIGDLTSMADKIQKARKAGYSEDEIMNYVGGK